MLKALVKRMTETRQDTLFSPLTVNNQVWKNESLLFLYTSQSLYSCTRLFEDTLYMPHIGTIFFFKAITREVLLLQFSVSSLIKAEGSIRWSFRSSVP